MKKTSIYLDPELDAALARRADEEGLTKAELIRRTLAQAVQRPVRPRPRAIGVVRSGDGTISEHVDRYLADTGFGQR